MTAFMPQAVTPERLTGTAISGYAESRRKAGSAVSTLVSGIVDDVERRGFAAVKEYTRRFDRADIRRERLAASPREFSEAWARVSRREKAAMCEMRDRIGSFAAAQKAAISAVRQKTKDGATTLAFIPVERVGIYVPAGRAPLFSSLFMAAIPAKAAGVGDIIVCTPAKGQEGADPRILSAARICGIKKVYKVGGAQAIAAMAFGLRGMFPGVDMICGPGNAYVNAAKQEISSRSTVRIDVPAGPSEVLVIADGSSPPAFAAADMLAQAEHGPDSAAVCICTSERVADQVALQLDRQLASLPPGNQARESIPKWGRIFIAGSVKQAVEAANRLAPEHLELLIKDAKTTVPLVRNAGAVFINTAEAFCDYGMSGGNHILPTGSASRAWGGVNVQSFGKWMYVDELCAGSQSRLAGISSTLARMEGLEAHARAAEAREGGE